MHLATADGMKEVPFPGSIQCLSFASSSELTHSPTKLSCRRWCLNRVLQEELAKTNGSCFRQKGWCKWRQRDGKLYAMWKEDEGYCVLWSIKCGREYRERGWRGRPGPKQGNKCHIKYHLHLQAMGSCSCTTRVLKFKHALHMDHSYSCKERGFKGDEVLE